MKRLQDWPERLAALVEERRLQPFAWGANDCCSFAADAIQAMTGEDLMAEWRGYDSVTGAGRLIAQVGGIGQAADSILGARVAPAFAGRGDLLMVKVGDQQSLAICLGRKACAPGVECMTFIDTLEAACAWRI